MRAFLLTLSLEINVIGWKINDWMDRQTDRRGGWWGAERSWCKSLNDGPIFCLSLRYVVISTHRRLRVRRGGGGDSLIPHLSFLGVLPPYPNGRRLHKSSPRVHDLIAGSGFRGGGQTRTFSVLSIWKNPHGCRTTKVEDHRWTKNTGKRVLVKSSQPAKWGDYSDPTWVLIASQLKETQP